MAFSFTSTISALFYYSLGEFVTSSREDTSEFEFPAVCTKSFAVPVATVFSHLTKLTMFPCLGSIFPFTISKCNCSNFSGPMNSLIEIMG